MTNLLSVFLTLPVPQPFGNRPALLWRGAARPSGSPPDRHQYRSPLTVTHEARHIPARNTKSRVYQLKILRRPCVPARSPASADRRLNLEEFRCFKADERLIAAAGAR